MRTAIALLALMAAAGGAPPKKAIPPAAGAGSDQKVSIDGILLLDRAQMTSRLGHDPGENIVIVEVKFTPAKGEKIYLNRDDFLLRSDRDGQRARPLEPTQIAGTSVMVISSRGGTQGEVMSQERRVPYGVPGGYPGGVPGSYPPGTGPTLPMPGQSPVGGSATADTSEAQASIEERPVKANPLLDALKAKVLPEGETEEPVSGLLYFLMEGKLRVKDLELVYRKAPPRVSLRFKEPGKK